MIATMAAGFSLGDPMGIALDTDGNVFSTGGWKVSRAGKVSGMEFYSADGQRVCGRRIGITVDSKGNLFLVSGDGLIKLEPIASKISIDAVTNGASGLAGAIAPGEIVVIYTEGVGPRELTM